MENEKKYLPEKVETYEELKSVFEEFRVDPKKTRFFMGSDYTEPRAFVIYQDDFGDFVVYKMKDDGTRALRYKGSDEKHAVNEYYQKFLSEVRKRPEFAQKLLRPASSTRPSSTKGSDSDGKWFIYLTIAALVLLILAFLKVFPIWAAVVLFLLVNPGIFLWQWLFGRRTGRRFPPKIYSIISLVLILLLGSGSMIYKRFNHRHDGYYVTPQGAYYTQGHDVYYYNNGWYYYGLFDDFYDDYYDDYTYYDSYEDNSYYEDFSDSEYYDDWKDSDWDSDDDDSGWSSDDSWDSWDSGGSDWGSDW